MRNQILAALIVITTAFLSFAQPEVSFILPFDNQRQEAFNDIYLTANNQLVVTGVSSVSGAENPGGMRQDPYLMRTDLNGREIWRSVWQENQASTAMTVVEADDGDLVGAGRQGDNFWAFRTSADGELRWSRTYGAGQGMAIIELKNNNFLIAGYSTGGNPVQGYLQCIRSDGEPIWNRLYNAGRSGYFYALRETNEGAVAAGYGSMRVGDLFHAWALKVSVDNGEVIWSSVIQGVNNFTYQTTYCMTSAGDGGFVLGGASITPVGSHIIKINANGQYVWHRLFEGGNTQTGFYGITRTENRDLMLVGRYVADASYNRPLIRRVTSEGVTRWNLDLELDRIEGYTTGQNYLSSVVFTPQNELIACGWCRREEQNRGYDGILLKLEPDIVGPHLLRYSPEDTTFYVLDGAEITFSAFAVSAYRDELQYAWFYDDTTALEAVNDTSTTVLFDEPGEHTVEVLISDEDASITVRWRVTADDFYIVRFTPDTLNLGVRRGDSLNFSVDSIATLLEGEPDFHWVLTDNAGNQSVFDGESSTNWHFTHSGHYQVECVASIGEANDDVVWNLDAAGLIWWYLPEQTELELLAGASGEFLIIPFVADTINRFEWYLNDELVGSDSMLAYRFGQSGEFTVKGVLCDSTMRDSVFWNLIVLENAVSGNLGDMKPTAIILSASPNPFNSTVTIRFQSVQSVKSAVNLSIHDITGREVARLVDEKAVNAPWLTAKTGSVNDGALTPYESITWDASAFPAGIYFARLESGGEVRTVKMVLVR